MGLEESSIEWTLSMEEKARISASTCTHKTCTNFQVRILRIDIGSSNKVPQALLLHHLQIL